MAKFVPDIKTQRWIVISPVRQARPDEEREMAKPRVCPFCEGNEKETPPEILRIGVGEKDTPGWKIRVVPNKFPITDIHEVIIHSPDHNKDIEDFALMHIVFEDGTFADIFASELVLGGVHNWIEVNTNNHRTICNINPNNSMQTYTPDEKHFKDVYIVEKTETKQGWSSVSPDEGWFTGYQHEMEAFYRSAAFGNPIESDSTLAADVIATIYAGYLSAEKKGTEVPITLL